MSGTKTKKISSYYIYFFSAFGGILFGYDIGVMTGALPFLISDWSIDDSAIIGWITSTLMVGAIFGGLFSGHLSDKLGRKKVILISSFVFATGALLAAFSPSGNLTWLLVSRFILGLGVGAASALVPSYMSEMAPAKKRGRISGLNQLMIVSGMLLSYIVDFILQVLPDVFAWRLMLGLAAVPALILFLGVLRLPESPRFLVKLNKIEEAKKVLTYIRPKEDVDSELEDIIETVKGEINAQQNISFISLFSKKYRALVIAGVGVCFLQQIMGANAIFYYIPLIVENATGQAASSALMWPIVQGVILVGGAIFYMIIADKYKRRGMLIQGGMIMGASFLAPSLMNLFVGQNNYPSILVILFLCIYVCFYSFTWAPLTWVLAGEIFPLAIRGRASGLASSLNWFGSFAVGLLFPIMSSMLSQAIVFGVFGIICLGAIAFVHFFVPETKGKSLEEIESAGVNIRRKNGK